MEKAKILSALTILALLAAGWLFFAREPAPGAAGSLKTYRSEAYGISFSYPALYRLEEREVGGAERGRYVIVLTEDTEENRLIREGKSPGREGPTAITVEVFQNNLDRTPLEAWVEGTSYSNYKLALAPYRETTLAGVPALAYSWDGLYRGESVVAEHARNIVMLSVTYLAPEDAIRAHFETVRSTAAFF